MDAGGFEERGGSNPETRRGLFALVGVDLGVGQPGVVIDRVMQECIAATTSAVAVVVSFAPLSTHDPMPAAIGYAAEFLDVDMDKLARGGLLIANETIPTNRQPGRLVQVSQQRHSISVQHSANGRPRNTEVIADPVRSPPARESQREDSPFQP
jgi:hypothetical protein